MQREIKFRYVIEYEGNKIQTFILTLDEIQKHCGAWNEVNIFCENVGITNYQIIARNQFTGLYGEDGVEIFEGDIIWDITNHKHPVGISIYELTDKRKGIPCWCANGKALINDEEYRVIGNMYENANILKTK